VNGPYIPVFVLNGIFVAKPFDELTVVENKHVQYDCIAKNIITSALNLDEFFRVSQYNSAKEMWDVLEVTHEGTTDVKRARKHALIQKYELFIMQQGESIANVWKRFTHIVNHLIRLGKQFDKEKLNIKILKCLDKSWQPKVTTISESRDLTTLTTAALFGKLREHELEMTRLKEMETAEKKTRSLKLKVKAAEVETSEDNAEEDSDAENLSLLTKKFQKFIKLKSRTKNQQTKRYNRKPDSNSNKLTCFSCGKQGILKQILQTWLTKKRPLKRRTRKLEREERHILHGKTMHLHPVALHRKTLKQIYVSWLERILRLVVKIPALHLTVQITVHYFKLFMKPMKKQTDWPYLTIE